MPRRMNPYVRRMIRNGKMTEEVIARRMDAYYQSQLEEFDAQLEAIAEDEVEKLRDDIFKGRLNLVENSPAWAAMKARVGGGEVPLVSTGEYAKSIRVTKLSTLRYYVGVSAGVTHSSGLPMGFLANILEYGTTDGIPPRPHLAPAARRIRDRVQALVRGYVSSQK